MRSSCPQRPERRRRSPERNRRNRFGAFRWQKRRSAEWRASGGRASDADGAAIARRAAAAVGAAVGVVGRATGGRCRRRPLGSWRWPTWLDGRAAAGRKSRVGPSEKRPNRKKRVAEKKRRPTLDSLRCGRPVQTRRTARSGGNSNGGGDWAGFCARGSRVLRLGSTRLSEEGRRQEGCREPGG